MKKIRLFFIGVFMLAISFLSSCGTRNDTSSSLSSIISSNSNSTSVSTSIHEHVWDKGTITKKSTCSEEGEITYNCDGCDETKVESTSALNHIYANGSCEMCGATEGLKYTFVDGGYSVSAGTSINNTNVVIPKFYNGFPVIKVDDYAFFECASITNITIPDSVTSIGSSAFEWCISLTNITIPDSVTSIGELAFNGCNIEAFTLFENGFYLGNKNNPYLVFVSAYKYGYPYEIKECKIHENTKIICYYAFYACSSLTSITIPESVTSIGDGAFGDCSSLTSITIPESVISIGDYAFSGCTSLTNITIPESVTSIGDGAFGDCSSLIRITIPESVISIGDYAFSGCTSLTSITIPESTTSIGDFAFEGCSSLTSITIPESVISIGDSAFEYCSSLESITLPFVGNTLDSTENTHFGYIFGASGYNKNSSCVPSSLKEVIITGGTSIGDYAFYDCSSLTSITIPDSVTSIGDSAFEGCSSLVYNTLDNGLYLGNKDNPYLVFISLNKTNNEFIEFTINENTKIIYDSAFFSCWSLTNITIPDNITSIGYSAFFGCGSLTNVYYEGTIEDWCNISFVDSSSNPMCYTKNFYMLDSNNDYYKVTEIEIPNTITSIGNYAFYGYSSLESITIPDSVTSIGSRAFTYCSSLESVTITDSVTSIGDGAFSGCSSLESITIPDSITSIETDAFFMCSITNVYYEGTIEDWCNISFSNHSSNPMYWGKRFYMLDENNEYYEVKELEIPKTITSIEKFQFSSFDNLTSITIPDSITSIGSSAFYGCSSLESITIPESVTSIGSSAFYGCSSLTNITIPDSITSIDYRAFYGCSSLTNITIPDSVTSIGDYAFCNCSLLANIKFSENIKSIGKCAFDGCDSLIYNTYNNALYLGNSNNEYFILVSVINNSFYSFDLYNNTKVICGDAFSGCSSLTNVYYNGSLEDWCNISFSNYLSNPMYYGRSLFITDDHNNYYELIDIEIPNTVTAIGDYQFCGFNNLNSVIIPEGVKSIGIEAFSECKSLKDITIPNSVNYIGSSAFKSCKSLNFVEYNNGYYLGNLDNPYLVLVKMTDGHILKIHEDTTIICDNAFSYDFIIIKIIIPNKIEYIPSYLFSDCYYLTDICYQGTEDEWNKIKIEKGNDILLSVTITYNYVYDNN